MHRQSHLGFVSGFRNPNHICASWADCCVANVALPEMPADNVVDLVNPLPAILAGLRDDDDDSYEELEDAATGGGAPAAAAAGAAGGAPAEESEWSLVTATRAMGAARAIPARATGDVWTQGHMGLHSSSPDLVMCVHCFPLDQADPPLALLYTNAQRTRAISGAFVNGARATSSLRKHLKRVHGHDLSALRDASQSSLVQAGATRLTARQHKFLNVSYAWNEVCMSLRTISLAGGSRDFLRDLQRSFTPPSHTWTAELLNKIIFPFARACIKDRITYVREKVYMCGTMPSSSDIWSSRANHGFFGLILGYVDWRTWVFHRITAACTEFDGSHCAKRQADKLNEMAKQCAGVDTLGELTSIMAIDNCASAVAALRDHTDAETTRCGLHTIILSPKHVLHKKPKAAPNANYVPEAAAVIDKCSKIQNHFSHANCEDYILCCKGAGEPETKLVAQNDTRFNSKHDMLGSLVVHEKTVAMYLVKKPTAFTNLSEDEWRCAGDLHIVLFPIKWATAELEGDGVPMSRYWPTLVQLVRSLQAHRPATYFDSSGKKQRKLASRLHATAQHVRANIQKDLIEGIIEKMTGKQEMTMHQAAFFDPEYRTMTYKAHANEEAKERFFAEVLNFEDEWVELGGEAHLELRTAEYLEKHGVTAAAAPSDGPVRRMTQVGGVRLTAAEQREAVAGRSLISDEEEEEEEDEDEENDVPREMTLPGLLPSLAAELAIYRRFKRKAGLSHSGVRMWWKDVGVAKHKLYRLAYLASYYLAMMVSSANVERLFSAAGRLVSALRASLGGEVVENILLVNTNKELFGAWEGTKGVKAALAQAEAMVKYLAGKRCHGVEAARE